MLRTASCLAKVAGPIAVRQLESVGVTDVTLSTPPDVTGAPSLQRIIEVRQTLAAAGY